MLTFFINLLSLRVVAEWDENHEIYYDDDGNKVKRNEIKEMPGYTVKESVETALPSDYIDTDSLPLEFDWGNVNDISYLTQSLNQHIPQYCGSCWAHGTLSSLADRIKIQRISRGLTANMPDIGLSIQAILNCGTSIAGSCLGGSSGGVYQWVMENSIPFSTCQTYIACSYDSEEGFCSDVDTTCKSENLCRTCTTFECDGGGCFDIDFYPNASISEYGGVSGVEATKAELITRGPVAAFVNAIPLLTYTGGILDLPDASRSVDHIVSITGWGYDEEKGEYWIVRNSWGEFWGELGFFRVVTGDNQLGIETWNVWATPDYWTELNYPCYETGDNCNEADLDLVMSAVTGWTEEDYKANVARYVKDSDSDYWRWAAEDCDAQKLSSQLGTFEAELSKKGEGISMQTTSFVALLAFVSLSTGLVVAFFLRCYYVGSKSSGDAGLSMQIPDEQHHNLYVVQN